MSEIIWISLVQVSPVSSESPVEHNAYVNVVGIADTQDLFLELIREKCERLALRVESIEDTETWRNRLIHSNPDLATRSIVEELSTHNPIEFGVFYCFEE